MRRAAAAGVDLVLAAVPVAVVPVAWSLALGVVLGPLVGLPEFAPSGLGGVDRSGLVACLALVGCSTPRPAARPRAAGAGAAALAAVSLFLPVVAVAGVLDAQDARPRAPAFAALVLTLAFGLAWSAERARQERRVATRHACAWALLVGLPAVAATLFAASATFAWCPPIWSLAPREPRLALGAGAVVALLVGLVLGSAPGVATRRAAPSSTHREA